MSETSLPLTRRDFVRGTVVTTLSASVLSGTQVIAEEAKPAGKSKVVIIRDEKALNKENKVDVAIVKKMIDETLIKFTGKVTAKEAWLSLVKPEDKIGLVTTDHLNPTHAEVIDAVIQSLTAAGIPEANINRNAQGSASKVEDRTALIAIPALKAHWLTGIGTVMKNYITFSGKPSSYHDANSAKLGEIWNRPALKGKTKLVLVDALRPLCDKGPQVDPRYLWNYNGFIAGTDPVAVETVCLKVIQEKRKELKKDPLSPPPLCIAAADKTYGLGTGDPAKIEIVKSGWDKDVLV